MGSVILKKLHFFLPLGFQVQYSLGWLASSGKRVEGRQKPLGSSIHLGWEVDICDLASRYW